MSYRDDHAALRTYHDNLVRELERLEARTAELATAEADRDRIAKELSRVKSDLEQQRVRRSPIRLDNLRVASPCKEPWARMTGDDRVRDCARCEKQVFNLSEMTHAEVEELMSTRGITACVRFFRRADGTVMTADCPVGAKKQRRNLAIAAGVIAAGAGAGAVAMATSKDAPIAPPLVETHEVMMGEMVSVPVDVPDEVIMGKMAPPDEQVTMGALEIGHIGPDVSHHKPHPKATGTHRAKTR